MKNFFIAALLLLCLSAMAQNQPTPNEQLRQVFDPVADISHQHIRNTDFIYFCRWKKNTRVKT